MLSALIKSAAPLNRIGQYGLNNFERQLAASPYAWQALHGGSWGDAGPVSRQEPARFTRPLGQLHSATLHWGSHGRF